MEHLIQPANKILDLNWRGGFTIPTNTLYPFQWNWDSGFVSIGNRHRDIKKSMQEIDALFSGQWENGMLPHIIFHSENEKTYFPNYDFWNSNVNEGAPFKPKSSGITQPAVFGFVLEELLSSSPDDEELISFIKNIYPKIVRYHEFLYNYRDPHNEGLMFIYHPWESGRDNSPIWDESMDRIEIDHDTLPKYKRRDINIADPSERPTSHQYDRYVYLMQLGKKHRYDGNGISEESPFLIQDTLMNAILIRSNESLIRIAKRFKLDSAKIEEWQQQSISSFNQKLWNPDLEFYTGYDLRGQKQIEYIEIGGLTPLFAKIPSKEQAKRLNDYLENLHERGFYLCPSFDVDNDLFDSKRYWRGPVWPQMNWLIYHGLRNYEYNNTADIVRNDILELVDKLGFYEYFESQKVVVSSLKKGYGGELFSWTASTVLDLIKSK